MKIKAFFTAIILTLSLVIVADVKAFELPNYGVPNVKYGWEQEYLDEGAVPSTCLP